MAKKNIGKIIEKGTAKQRMLLLANHIAETATDKPGFLSKSEFNTLVESFKTPAEIKLYRKYKVANSALQSLLPYLAQLRLSYRVEYTAIEGYCYLYYSYLNFEYSINLVLDGIKDGKQRTEILDAFVKESVVLFAIPQKKRGKYVDRKAEFYDLSLVHPRKKKPGKDTINTLNEIIFQHRNLAMNLLSSIKTLLKSLKDYIEENDIQITAYNDLIKEIETEITDDNGRIDFQSVKYVLKTVYNRNSSHKLRHSIELIDDRNFYPEYDEAEIDQFEYDDYRRTYL